LRWRLTDGRFIASSEELHVYSFNRDPPGERARASVINLAIAWQVAAKRAILDQEGYTLREKVHR